MTDPNYGDYEPYIGQIEPEWDDFPCCAPKPASEHVALVEPDEQRWPTGLIALGIASLLIWAGIISVLVLILR